MSGRKLQGKVAIVTGASRGIGAAIAERLAGDGAAVVVNYAQSEKEAMELVGSIRSGGGRATAIRADCADPAAITDLFERAFAEYGRLDILVNNAGVFLARLLTEIDLADYERVFNLNVRGVLLASKEAARRLSDGGRIINISSVAAKRSRPTASVYGASKSAIEAFTRCHATELGPRGITVNAVAPGLVETDMSRLLMQTPEMHARVSAGIKASALGRTGTPEEIAGVVAFLASDDARWLTGEVIEVSGGAP